MIEMIPGIARVMKDLWEFISTQKDKPGLVRYGFACTLAGVFAYLLSSDCIAYRCEDRQLLQAVHTGRRTAAKDTFAEWLLNQRIQATRDGLATEGAIVVPTGDLNRTALRMMREVHSNLLATSSAKGWWEHEFGDKYQRENEMLVNQRTITRIFLYANKEELAALRPVLEAQKKARINVYIAPLDQSLPLGEDYVVIDDRIAGRLKLSGNRSPLQAEFYFDKERVDAVKQQIELIAKKAQPYSPDAQPGAAGAGGS